MLSDLIYGPTVTLTSEGRLRGAVVVRSVLIDLEGLLEAVAVAHLPGYTRKVSYTTRGHAIGLKRESRRLLESDLAGLGPTDRQNLSVLVELEQRKADGEVANFTIVEITFRVGQATTVRAVTHVTRSAGPQPMQVLALPVARALIKDGTPIVPWRQHAPHLVMLPVLLMVACWAALLGSYKLLPPAVLLGWTALFSVGVGAVAIDRYLRARVASRVPGVRIREESRAQTASRRAESKRDLKVIVLTAAATILGGVILAILTNGFGLIPPD
ncbi:hypothetical protein ACMA46_11800 [Clavibacter sp. Sh2141]|uniref:hypothetical protein n=1 Tax=Clavibacter sp. Sh2141 TaxID=3395374 RepID=UPI0039BCC4C5